MAKPIETYVIIELHTDDYALIEKKQEKSWHVLKICVYLFHSIKERIQQFKNSKRKTIPFCYFL
jgi:hypothetical protein